MAKLDIVHKKLLSEWKKDAKRDVQLIGEILKEGKEAMNDEGCLKELNQDALFVIHRDIFEIDAMYALLCEDLQRFNEAVTIVLNFYNSYSSAAQSSNKYLMIGLHLMNLLATNRLAEFHMLLEQVEQSVQKSNPYISTPVNLEQSLMEGVYNKVVLTENTIPSPFYSIFIRILMDTVRSEIATCIEAAFKRLSVKDAAQMLFFINPDDVVFFAKQRKWRTSSGVYVFDAEKPVEEKPKSHLEAERIAKQNIFYAKQLEMIV